MFFVLFPTLAPFFFFFFFFFFNDTATTEIYTLSLHDALPTSLFVTSNVYYSRQYQNQCQYRRSSAFAGIPARSEEHTSELQSRPHLVCRLLLEKKKKKKNFARLIKKINKQKLI